MKVRGVLKVKGIGWYIFFSLFIIISFAYIFNMMPSKINREYNCKEFELLSKEYIGEIDVQIQGRIRKKFFALKHISGIIKYKNKIIELDREVFNNEFVVVENHKNIIVLNMSIDEKNIVIIDISHEEDLEGRIIANCVEDDGEFIQKYYEFIKTIKEINSLK